MRTKRICSLLAGLLYLIALAVPAAAAEVDCDSVYCFSAGDFSEAENFTGICVTALPEAKTGTVMLGSRIIRPGDILTVDQLACLTFCPLQAEADQSAMVTYLPIFSDRVETSATVTIAVRGKQDQAPVAEDSTMETYKNLPNEAMLKVKDPEGKALTHTLIRAPRRGDVVLREDGSFIYTPKKNKVGVDSFTYTATDPAGNVSREATVTITIMKPTDAGQYADTAGESCRFAAEWMKNTGIFVGESIGGNSCFRPTKTVSRGEFLTMLVGALELQPEQLDIPTGYADELPGWLQPYLAAAVRSGIMAGIPARDTFDADSPIPCAEAAVMLQNILDLSASEDAQAVSADANAHWAASALGVLADHGIVLDMEGNLTRGQAAQMLYQASQLSDTAPGMAVLPRQ